MSPYQQAVTDLDKAKAQEEFEASRKGFEARGVQAGGMSGLGSRMAVESDLRERSHLANLAGIQARGSQKAFEDARKAFEQQKLRERQAGTDIIGVGKDIYSTGVAEQGLMAQVGEAERADTQQQLDDLYRRFTQRQDFPETELAKYSGFVYGNPYLRGASDTTTTRLGPKGPSFGQQLVSGAIQGAGQFAGGYGRGLGGKAAGGGRLSDYKARHGGGLHDIMYDRYVNRKGGGLTSLPVVHRQDGDFIASDDWWSIQEGSGGSLPDPGWSETFEEKLALQNIQNRQSMADAKEKYARYGVNIDDIFSDIKTKEERIKQAKDRQRRREALVESQKRSAWGDALASLGAVVEGLGAQYGTTAVVGSAGIPYYPSTGQQVMSKRFEELHKERSDATAAEKARKRAELEAEFKLEDEIAGIPEELRKRIRDIKALKLTRRREEAMILKARAQAYKDWVAAQDPSRTGKFPYPTETKLEGIWDTLEGTFELADQEDTDILRSLSGDDQKRFVMEVLKMQHSDKRLGPQEAYQKAFDKLKSEGFFEEEDEGWFSSLISSIT